MNAHQNKFEERKLNDDKQFKKWDPLLLKTSLIYFDFHLVNRLLG